MKKLHLLLTLLILSSTTILSQDGALDTTFANNGIFSTNGNFQYSLLDLSIDNSNNIYISGNVINSDGTTSVKVIKLLPEGELDTSFGNAGFATIHYNPWWYVSKTIILESGKIALVGRISSNSNDIIVVRLNSDGSIDNSFGNNGRFIFDSGNGNDQAFTIVEQNSKLIIGGVVQPYSEYALLRLTEDGILDTTFGNNGLTAVGFGYREEIRDLIIDDSGNIVTCGHSRNTNNPYWNLDDLTILKFNNNGFLDSSFGDNGIVVVPGLDNERAYSIQYFQNSYYVTGQKDFADTAGSATVIVKINQNGVLDNSFNNDGKLFIIPIGGDFHGVYHGGYSSIIQNDNKLIVGGSWLYFGNPGLYEIRFNRITSNGVFDPEFGDNGISHFNLDASEVSNRALSKQFDNKFLALGLDYDENILLTRHNINQTLSTNDVNLDNVDFIVYPNPTEGELNINALNENSYKIAIVNSLGKLTNEFTFKSTISRLDLSHLESGVYFLKITSENATSIKKIVVK